MQAGLEQLLAGKSAVIGAWFLLLFVAERWHPAAVAPAAMAGGWRLLRNGALWAITAALSPLLVVPLSAAAALAAPAWRPLWWSGAGGLVGDLVLLDLLLYWWHRANHRLPLLWRFHAIHHLDRCLDTTTALRFHAGEVLLSALARAAIILLLALPLASVVVFETLVLAATLFHHSNLRLAPRLERVLSWLVVTPSIHWVHHHRRRIDTDANYATVLSLWDRLFASRSRHRRTPDMAIGVEGREEETLLGLLAAPFRAQARSRSIW
jgi:sterol desaturase/sphingolipid hydroxylase (fatty acid hydroxylase superfamily)